MIKVITGIVVFICMHNGNVEGAVVALGVGLILSEIIDD